MKKIVVLLLFITEIQAFGQSSVLIEPNGGNGIISKNITIVNLNPGEIPLPVSGSGTRLMWIPSKSAFRVGTVDSDQWDASKIGTWSFAIGENSTANSINSTAMGYNTLSSGTVSTAMGYDTKALGFASTAIGESTEASGANSTAMGNSTEASGAYSTAMGYNTMASNYASTAMGDGTIASNYASTAMGNLSIANGDISTAMGNNTRASGFASTTMGANTTAQSFISTALGRFNIISGTTSSWVNSEPLFIVGNGVDNANRNNALTLLKNSNLGLNTATPQYQLSFKDDLGDKISFYYGNTSNNTNHYGIGIQAAKFQLFTPSDDDDVVFGYGRSAAFTENVRFKGKGQVGIGVNNPSEFLDVNGRMRVRHRPGNTAGVWMSNDVNSTAVGDGAFYGLKSNTEAGIFIGGAWRFGVTNTGVVSASGGISVGGGETIAKIRKTSVTYNIPSIPANSSILDTFTISDLSSTDNIIVNPDGTIFPLIIAYTRYIASTVMEIVFYNPTNVAVDIPSRSFNVTVIK